MVGVCCQTEKSNAKANKKLPERKLVELELSVTFYYIGKYLFCEKCVPLFS